MCQKIPQHQKTKSVKTIGEGFSKKYELLDNIDKKIAFHSTQNSILTDKLWEKTWCVTLQKEEKTRNSKLRYRKKKSLLFLRRAYLCGSLTYIQTSKDILKHSLGWTSVTLDTCSRYCYLCRYYWVSFLGNGEKEPWLDTAHLMMAISHLHGQVMDFLPY